MTVPPSQSLTEEFIGVIGAFGGVRPTSMGLSELYQDLIAAINHFAAGNAPLNGMFPVTAYGAVGDGVHDDTVAVQAAIAAANAKGGIVYYPPGNYRCTAQLTYYPNTIWAGAGVSATRLTLAVELWPGGSAPPANFIVPAPSGWNAFNSFKMRDMHVHGNYQGSGTPGVNGSNTIGIRTTGGAIFENLFVAGFFAGFEQVADHETYRSVYATSNYYGIDWSDNVVTNGNQAFYSCKFSGNYLAGFHLSPYSGLLNVAMHQTHFGFGPVGLFRTDAFSGWDVNNSPTYAPASAKFLQAGMYDTELLETMFEAIGNGAYIDVSTLGTQSATQSIIACSQLQSTWTSWAPQYKSTFAPLDNVNNQAAWWMVLRVTDEGSSIQLPSVPVGSSGFIYTAANASLTIKLGTSGIPANMLGSMSNPVPQWTNLRGRVLVEGATASTFGEAYILSVNSNNTINVGDCLEHASNAALAVLRATGTRPCFGVALTPVVLNATVASACLVLQQGYFSVLGQTGAAAMNIGQPLYLSSTTHYLVDQTSTANPIVGIAYNNPGTGASTVGARIALVT